MLRRGVCSLLLLSVAVPASAISVESAQAASSSMAPGTKSKGSQSATAQQRKTAICKLVHSIQPGLSHLHAFRCHAHKRATAPKQQRGTNSQTGSIPKSHTGSTAHVKLKAHAGPALPLFGPPQLRHPIKSIPRPKVLHVKMWHPRLRYKGHEGQDSRSDGKGNAGKANGAKTKPKDQRSTSKPKQPSGYWATYLVTAYCLSGTTASGAYTSWGTVAATLPFYTHVYVPGYGPGTVLDRGGAVGPGHVDIYMPSCGQAFAWGSRVMNIQIYT